MTNQQFNGRLIEDLWRIGESLVCRYLPSLPPEPEPIMCEIKYCSHPSIASCSECGRELCSGHQGECIACTRCLCDECLYHHDCSHVLVRAREAGLVR